MEVEGEYLHKVSTVILELAKHVDTLKACLLLPSSSPSLSHSPYISSSSPAPSLHPLPLLLLHHHPPHLFSEIFQLHPQSSVAVPVLVGNLAANIWNILNVCNFKTFLYSHLVTKCF